MLVQSCIVDSSPNNLKIVFCKRSIVYVFVSLNLLFVSVAASVGLHASSDFGTGRDYNSTGFVVIGYGSSFC